MAKRPGPVTRKQTDVDRASDFMIGGGGIGLPRKYRQIADPMGFSDTFFGGEFVRPDLSELDAENEQIEAEMLADIPDDSEFGDYTYGGDFNPERLGDTNYNDMGMDPRTRDLQLRALMDLERQVNEGLTMEDRAARARLDADVNRQNAGRVEAIKQDMAARGGMGSGLELVAQMSNAQAQTDRQAQNALEVAAAREAAKREAMSRMGAESSRMRGQDFNEARAKAEAQDTIDRFNAAAAQDAGLRNTNMRQDTSNRNVTNRNNVRQQRFDNRMAVNTIRANNNTNKANEALAGYQAAVDQNNKNKSGLFSGAGGILAGIGSIVSDENQKEAIRDVTPEEIEEFILSIKPKRFRYRDESFGEGERVGTMAQDLEDSSIGQDIVDEGPHGKEINIENALGAILDSLAYINAKVG